MQTKIFVLGAGGYVGRIFVQVCRLRQINPFIVDWRNPHFVCAPSGESRVCVVDFAAPNPAAYASHFDFEASVASYLGKLDQGYSSFRPKFVFHLSSSRVYGIQPVGKISTESPVRPDCSYGRSKVLAEDFYRARADSFDVPTVVARAAAIVGPGCHPNFPSRLAESLIRKTDIVCASPESLYNNLVNVHELSEFILSLCLRRSFPAGVTTLNLGSPKPITLSQLVHIAAEALGVSSSGCVQFDSFRGGYYFDDYSALIADRAFSPTNLVARNFFGEIAAQKVNSVTART